MQSPNQKSASPDDIGKQQPRGAAKRSPAIPVPSKMTASPPPQGVPLETPPPRGWGDTGTDRVVIVRNGTPAFAHNILTGNPDFRMIFYDTPKGVFNQE